jgi:glyoxylase-like metal-dependent hydrolase (beta-lactamase superfamily II)
MPDPLIFTGGSAVTNGYLHEHPGGPLLIDAPRGCLAWLQDLEKKPVALLLTHQHYDHVEDAAAVAAWAGCPILAWRPYEEMLTLVPLMRVVGMEMEIEPYEVTTMLEGKAELPLPGVGCRLFPLPGHAADSVVFYFPGEAIAYVGDTLMPGGLGRTDLPGGSWQTLEDGIRRHLFTLPPETLVLSGHGPPTTIGREMATNPFLRG